MLNHARIIMGSTIGPKIFLNTKWIWQALASLNLTINKFNQTFEPSKTQLFQVKINLVLKHANIFKKMLNNMYIWCHLYIFCQCTLLCSDIKRNASNFSVPFLCMPGLLLCDFMFNVLKKQDTVNCDGTDSPLKKYTML
jgi:hypothetical protein